MRPPSVAKASPPRQQRPGIARAAGWLPALLWMAIIYVLSAQPSLPSLEQPTLDQILKGLSHAGEYAVLAYLLSRPLRDENGQLTASKAVLVWGICALYATSDEYHQLYVPGRVSDWLDILADCLGAGAMLLALRQPSLAAFVLRVESRLLAPLRLR